MDLTAEINSITGLIVAALGSLAIIVVAMIPVVIALRRLWVAMKRGDDFTDQRISDWINAHMLRGQAMAVMQGQLQPDKLSIKIGDEIVMAYRHDVAQAYQPVIKDLRKIAAKWKENPGRLTLAETIENYQWTPLKDEPPIKMGVWLATHVCPVLKIDDLKCLAIAEVLATDQLTQMPFGIRPDSDQPLLTEVSKK